MSASDLLSRLDGVRQIGIGQYMTRCPAHEDRSPSLSIKDCDDGRVLLRCFAGCETENVLAAVGLSFSDVMPERISEEHFYTPVRQRIPPRDALTMLDHEALVVAIIGADILEHKQVDEETWSRLALAVNRINETKAYCAPARVGR
jgi:hypothetical protein